MAISSGFFNSVNGDRRYNADDISNYFLNLISDGVFATPSNAMQIQAASGMTVSVSPGWAFVKCRWLHNDTPYNLTLDASDAVLNRVDRIVVRLDMVERKITLAVIKGSMTAATEYQYPTLTRNENVYELSLARIEIPAGTAVITQSMIHDERPDTAVCGFVTGLIDQIDTTNLFAQYDAAFSDWFANVRETLATTTLIRQYTSSYTTTRENEQYIPIGISQYNENLDILNVYISGLKLIQGVDYAKNGATIVLSNPLDVIGTTIEFEVLKSIDGSEAESVVDMVYQLQQQTTTDDRNNYHCNGVNDNVELMNYIASWEQGSARKDRINIIGTFGVSTDTTAASDGNAYSFVYECERECGVTLDFSGCDAITANANNFMYVSGCTVKNLTIMHNGTAQSTERFDIVCNNATLEHCFVHGSFTGSATVRILKPNNSRLIHCDIDVESVLGTVIGITPTASTMTNCKINAISTAGEVYGVICADGSRFDGCEFTSTTKYIGKTARGGYGGGNYSNCVFVAMGINGAHGYYINGTTLFSANNCVFRGYVQESTTGVGTGLTGNNNATALLHGINCNQVTVDGYKQVASMSFTTATGAFDGCFWMEPTVPETMVAHGKIIANKT